jgi:hypothetical protein
MTIVKRVAQEVRVRAVTRQKIIDLNQKSELKSAEREPKGSCASVG